MSDTVKESNSVKASKKTSLKATGYSKTKTLGFVSVSPNPKTLLSARKAGYDPYSAIADMVDNAMEPQVGATDIYISVDANKHVIVADNGIGMNSSDLQEGLRLGSKSNPQTIGKILGGFGMGLKTAGSSMGTVITVISRKEGESLVTAVYDILEMNRNGNFLIPILLSTKAEKDLFEQHTKGAKSGTVIQVSSLDQIKNRNTTSFITVLRRRLSEIFRMFIKTSEIVLDGVTKEISATNLYINDVIVEPSDVMMESSGSRLMYDDTHLIAYRKDGQKAQATVRFKLYLLPDINGKGQGEEENDMRLSLSNQGLYVLRNNRQIVRADMLEIVSRHPIYNRFRGEVYVDGDLDEALSLNFQKNSIASREEAVQRQIKSIIHPQINYIREIIDQERGNIDALDEQMQAETNKILKEINLKAKELGLVGRVKREAVERDEEVEDPQVEPQPEAKKSTPKAPKGEGALKSPLEIQYLSLGSNNNIAEYTYKDNNGMILTWNTDHSFYFKFLAKSDFTTRRAVNIQYLLAGLIQNRVFTTNNQGQLLNILVTDYNQQLAEAMAVVM